MRIIFGATFYSHIIVECNTSNHDIMLETHETFINFLEFMSLNMRSTKSFFTFVITLQIKRKESIQKSTIMEEFELEVNWRQFLSHKHLFILNR